jgi:hypothetical protein
MSQINWLLQRLGKNMVPFFWTLVAVCCLLMVGIPFYWRRRLAGYCLHPYYGKWRRGDWIVSWAWVIFGLLTIGGYPLIPTLGYGQVPTVQKVLTLATVVAVVVWFFSRTTYSPYSYDNWDTKEALAIAKKGIKLVGWWIGRGARLYVNSIQGVEQTEELIDAGFMFWSGKTVVNISAMAMNGRTRLETRVAIEATPAYEHHYRLEQFPGLAEDIEKRLKAGIQSHLGLGPNPRSIWTYLDLLARETGSEGIQVTFFQTKPFVLLEPEAATTEA